MGKMEDIMEKRPKRPNNGYFRYRGEVMRLRREAEEKGKDKNDIELLKWEEVDEDDKKRYEQEYKDELEIYERKYK